MRAKYIETRQYAGGTRADLSVSAAARACGFRVCSESPLEYKLRVRINMWSYGETLVVRVGDVDGQLMIQVASWCSMPFQVADWGKNRKNVAAFFEAIESQLPSLVEKRVLPHCPRCEFLVVSPSPVCTDCGHPLTDISGKAGVARIFRFAVMIPILVFTVIYSAGILLSLIGVAPPRFMDPRMLLPSVVCNIPILAAVLGLSWYVERRSERASQRRDQASQPPNKVE